jgi:hypothetical protein
MFVKEWLVPGCHQGLLPKLPRKGLLFGFSFSQIWGHLRDRKQRADKFLE